MKLKFLSLFLILALVFVTGCSESDKNADLPSSDTESTEMQSESFPVLFVDKHGVAHVICVFENGVYHPISDYQYSGKDWSEYIGKEEQEVTAPFIKKGDQFILYDTKNVATETSCEGIECVGRGIDDFTEVKVKLAENTAKNKLLVGVLADKNSGINNVNIGERQITADLDGNLQQDKIEWSFSPSTEDGQKWTVSPSDDNVEFLEYTLDIDINGEKSTFKNEEYCLNGKDGLKIFVLDINMDENYEILIYKDAGICSWVDVYSAKGGQLELMFDYVINPGP